MERSDQTIASKGPRKLASHVHFWKVKPDMMVQYIGRLRSRTETADYVLSVWQRKSTKFPGTDSSKQPGSFLSLVRPIRGTDFVHKERNLRPKREYTRV